MLKINFCYTWVVHRPRVVSVGLAQPSFHLSVPYFVLSLPPSFDRKTHTAVHKQLSIAYTQIFFKKTTKEWITLSQQ